MTAADYGYMFEVIDGCAEMTELDADENIVNPDAKLNIEDLKMENLLLYASRYTSLNYVLPNIYAY